LITGASAQKNEPKHKNYYYPNILDPSLPYSYGEHFSFTTDTNVFKSWVDVAGPGGDTEYQLDILMFAKDMAPYAFPGLYIALATDEDSDSEPRLLRADVANMLTEARCIVFIDCAVQSLVSYYQPLAVNGGAVETNLDTYHFDLMRQAILGY
jgi:hypothetical protein